MKRLAPTRYVPRATSFERTTRTRLRTQVAPRGIQHLLTVIGLYLLFPAADIPIIGVSFSAPLFALLFWEMTRSGVSWGLPYHRPLIRRATFLAAALLLSWVVNLVLRGGGITVFELALGLRLPYWLFAMVLVAIVVGQTRDPGFYLRVLAWGVIGSGAFRLGLAVFGGMWKLGREAALTQNTYGLLFSTFWPFALVMAVEARRRIWISRLGLVVLFVAIVINGSRGAWVTVTLTTGLYLTISLTYPGKGRSRVAVVLTLMTLLAVSAVGLALLLRGGEEKNIYVQRARTFRNLDQDSSYQIRVAMRKKALALFRTHPILGVGPGRFTRTHTMFDVPERLRGKSLDRLNRTSSHSGYFQFLAETGLIASLALLILVSWLALTGFRTARHLGQAGLTWPLGFWLGFVGMSVHLIVVAALLGTLPWFVYGLVGGMISWPRLNAAKW